MKKLLIILLIALSSVTFSLDSYLRFGAVTDNQSYNGEDEFTNYSPTGGIEITQSLFLFDVGAGAQYYHEVEGSDVSTLPVYGLVRWNIIPIAIKPYLVAKAGKVVYTDDTRNGSDAEGDDFYAGGVGISIRNIQLEALYTETKFDDTSRRQGGDTIEQVSITAGYKF